MTLTLEATVGQRGQVVIPKPIREHFGIRAGITVYFSVDDDSITVRVDSAALDDYLDAVEPTDEPDVVDWDRAYAARFEG